MKKETYGCKKCSKVTSTTNLVVSKLGICKTCREQESVKGGPQK